MAASWITYALGPFYTLMPRRWRAGQQYGSESFLGRAALFSGVAESLLALFALRTWYLSFFGMLGQKYMEYYNNSKSETLFAWEPVTWAGFITFITLPLTWLFFYFFLEGIVRATAGIITGEVFGSLPLYALDRLYRMFSGSLSRPELALVPDEVLRGDKKSDLRIASCRKRPLWKYPFTIKYGGAFFQFIGSRDTVLGARPYIYRLRRLPPGEIARGLREYDPEDILREPPRVAALL